jgi:hypothetical protein
MNIVKIAAKEVALSKLSKADIEERKSLDFASGDTIRV